ncbi:hypothetical protein [Mangrovicella endophytica]|uniref:hypothetical protein n=1 Tax=Mangrovicella endophytica TaxID=2066697 RepID=UPI000C9E5C37|nr:hypothetical protein [Mangrovicella endophytica]
MAILAAEASYWLYTYYPWIEAYFDAPKSLTELRRGAAEGWKDGYDIHHIVEEAAAIKDGFPDSMVNGPENLVRISRLKHWQISGWYQRKDPAFGWLSPRQYLRGKSWDEQYRIGLDALRREGILK